MGRKVGKTQEERKEMARARMQQRRSNSEFKEKERIANRERIKRKRSSNDDYRLEENKRKRLRAALTKETSTRVFENSLATYTNSIKNGPSVVCAPCGRLVYRDVVSRIDFNDNEILNKLTELGFDGKLISNHICKPCKNIVRGGKLPLKCTFPVIPQVLSILGPLEKLFVVVSKDSLVLPRELDEPWMIQGRNLVASRQQSIRPWRVFNACEHLATLDLYKNNRIEVNNEWKNVLIDQVLAVPRPPMARVRRMDSIFPINNDDYDNEEIMFPLIYCGLERQNNKSTFLYYEICKNEFMNHDSRCRDDCQKIYYSYKKLQYLAIMGQISNFMRQNAQNLIPPIRILRRIRGSEQYWDDKAKKLNCMIRQLGSPTFYITVSAGVHKWPELIGILYKLKTGIQITLDEANSLPLNERKELVNLNPIICCSYYKYRFRQLQNHLITGPGGAFSPQLSIKDFYFRDEFRRDGTPHSHGVVWAENAQIPQLDINNEDSIGVFCKFMDQFMECTKGVQNINEQEHRRCTPKCLIQKFDGSSVCSFGFPRPPLSNSCILIPFTFEERFCEEYQRHAENWKRVVSVLTRKFKRFLDFNDFLKLVKLSEPDYMLAIRSSIVTPKMFLRRATNEAYMNNYNRRIAIAWNSNMDIQCVLDPSKLSKYINKPNEFQMNSKYDDTLNAALKGLIDQSRHMNLRQLLGQIGKTWMTHSFQRINLVEACYICINLPLTSCSRSSVYINVRPEHQRVYYGDPKTDESEEDSVDYWPGLLYHYRNRPTELENVSLMEFASRWTFLNRLPAKSTLITFPLLHETGFIRMRQQSKIVCHKEYCEGRDPENFYRSRIMLYVPYREEHQGDFKKLYLTNLDKIKPLIPSIVSQLKNNEEPTQENEKTIISQSQQWGNILKSAPPKPLPPVQKCLPTEDFDKLVSKLNAEQSKYYKHFRALVHSRAIFHHCIHGMAGCGKSLLIQAICQEHLRIKKNNSAIIMCPTGKSASNVDGVTIHTALSISVNSSKENKYRLKRLIGHYEDLELVIIDEISLVNNELFNIIDSRLKKIKCCEKLFGGVSVVVVGDFFQLDGIGISGQVYSNSMWKEFEMYELTQIMRQNQDRPFAIALHRLAMGKLTAEDEAIFTSRLNKLDLPTDLMHLFLKNEDVDEFNEEYLNELSKTQENTVSEASHEIMNQSSPPSMEEALELFNAQYGLPQTLHLVVSAKYMLTHNIDVSAGLVNGTVGTLEKIEYNGEGLPQILHVRINENSTIQLEKTCTTFSLNSQNLIFHLIRTQFCICSCNAMTICKCQGSSFSNVVVHIEMTNDWGRQSPIPVDALYVACSRVKSSSNLFLVGAWPLRNSGVSKLKVIKELERLRTHSSLILLPENFYRPEYQIFNLNGFFGTVSSLGSLYGNNWLHDTAMDALGSQMCSSSMSVEYLDTIFLYPGRIHDYAFQVPFDCSLLYMFANAGENHWILIEVDINEALISVFDSFPECTRPHLHQIVRELQIRLEEIGIVQDEWTFSVVKGCGLQVPDSNNCGIYALLFLELVLSEQRSTQELSSIPVNTIPMARLKFASQLLQSTDAAKLLLNYFNGDVQNALFFCAHVGK